MASPLAQIFNAAKLGRKPLGAVALGSWGFWAGQFASSFPPPFDHYAAGLALFFAGLGGLAAFVLILRG